MGRARLTLAAVLLAVAGVSEAADDWGGWRDRVTLTLSDRLRGELVDWFRPRGAPRGAGRYGFFASRLRAGVSVTLPHVQLVLQGQDTRLANLPGDAVFPPPVGPLGPGALYVLHTHQTTQDRAGEPDARVPEALPSGGAPGGAVLVLARVAELRRRSRVV